MLGKTAFVLMLVMSLSLAANIHGTVYDWTTLGPLANSIVYVNSTPIQQLVSKDGSYSFELGAGTYEVAAKYYENNSLALEALEIITVEKEGAYVVDLIMFPTLDLGEQFFNESGPVPEEELYTEELDFMNIVILSVVLTTIFLIVASRFRFRPKETETREKPKRLPKESQKVLGIIRGEQRITQKELRKRLPWSEAKVSLIVADLEERGLIKKIKKGRGNILKLD